MVRYQKGDVLRSKAGVIAHGCNCRGGFGSGVAAAVAKRFPKARQFYLEKHETDGWELGDVQFVKVGSGYIANCATQDAYLPRGVCHADYDAIRVAMLQVKDFAQSSNLSVAIPKIGAGLAGGDWNAISKILEEVFSDYDVTVYVLE